MFTTRPRILSRLAFLFAAALPSVAQVPELGERHAMLPYVAYELIDLPPIDADGDGHVDLLALGPDGPPLLFQNDGNGVFSLVRGTLPSDVRPWSCAAVGDLDGDADFDVVLGLLGAGTPRAVLWRNEGDGSFVDASDQLPDLDGDTTDLELADLDGDLDLDVVLATDGWPLVYLNDGFGGFRASPGFAPASFPDTRALAVGDLDGDLDLDLIAVHSGAGSAALRVYWNDGRGTFVSRPIESVFGTGVEVGVMDLNGDQLSDVVFVSAATLQVLLADGHGGLFPVQNTSYGQYPATDLSFGDVNGDGWADAVMSTLRGSRLYLNAANGTGLLEYAADALPTEFVDSRGIHLVDVDADTDLDLVVANHHARNAQLFLNDGTTPFLEVTAAEPGITESHFWTVAVGDLDGDGSIDAIAGRDDIDRNRVYLNDGAGLLTDGGLFPFPNTATRALATGDVDGDGDIDALVGNAWSFKLPPSQQRLFLNYGDGTFYQDSARLGPTYQDDTSVIFLIDVDGDVDLDAVFLVTNGLYNRVLRNDGAGWFTDIPDAMPDVSISDAAAGDFDGDGDLDVFVGKYPPELWRNDGTGVFVPDPDAVPDLLVSIRGVAAGDVDGGGDFDVVLGVASDGTWYPDPARNRLLLNDGDGNFTESLDGLPDELDATRDVALLDVDMDADLDLMVSNLGEDGAPGDRLLVNDGLGHFVFRRDLPPPVGARQLGVADFDGDGDQDVLRAIPGSDNRVLFNSSRHLAWRGLPRVGKPLDLELHGPAGGRYLLLGAHAEGSEEVACGTLQLDRRSIFLREVGVFDGFGRAVVRIPIADEPELVGTTFVLQAIVDPPCAFTGIERVQLTAY